jgi:NitT/TauT family transport system substrate-binding protein
MPDGGETRTRRRALIAATLLAAVLLLGCGGGGDDGKGASDSGELKVAETAGLPSAFLSYGVQKGFFEDEGLKVTVEPGQGGAEAISTLVSGDVQVAGSNVISVLVAASKGIPLKLIGPGSFATRSLERDYGAVMVKRGSPIRAVGDLEGKTVAVNTLDNINEVALRNLLAKGGVDDSTVKLLEVPFPDMQAALEEGRVDAITTIEPFLTQTEAAGNRIVAPLFSSVKKGLQVGAFAMTAEQLERDPEAAKSFRAAVGKTAQAVADDPKAFRDYLAREDAVPPKLAGEISLPLWQERIDRASIDQLAALIERYRITDAKPSVEKVLEGTGQ